MNVFPPTLMLFIHSAGQDGVGQGVDVGAKDTVLMLVVWDRVLMLVLWDRVLVLVLWDMVLMLVLWDRVLMLVLWNRVLTLVLKAGCRCW